MGRACFVVGPPPWGEVLIVLAPPVADMLGGEGLECAVLVALLWSLLLTTGLKNALHPEYLQVGPSPL